MYVCFNSLTQVATAHATNFLLIAIDDNAVDSTIATSTLQVAAESLVPVKPIQLVHDFDVEHINNLAASIIRLDSQAVFKELSPLAVLRLFKLGHKLPIQQTLHEHYHGYSFYSKIPPEKLREIKLLCRREGLPAKWKLTPIAAAMEYYWNHEQNPNDPAYNTFLQMVFPLFELKYLKVNLYATFVRNYLEARVSVPESLCNGHDPFRIGRLYTKYVQTYHNYEFTWKADKGTLSNLHQRLKDGYKRMLDNAQNKHVLRGNLRVKFNGVSDERCFHQLSQEEAMAIGPVLKVTTKDQQHIKTFTLPLMKLQYTPYRRQVLVYLRDPHSPSGEKRLSESPSLIINEDGSCEGTRRARTLLDFLTLWDKEFDAVSVTIGKLLAHCIYCSTQMSRKESLERGCGAICLAKYGVAAGGLVVDNTTSTHIASNISLNTNVNTIQTQPNQREPPSETCLYFKVKDGIHSIPINSAFIRNSAVLSDMVEHCTHNNDPIIVPVDFMDKDVLKHLDSFFNNDYEDNILTLDRIVRACEYFEIEPSPTICRSIASVLLGNFTGLFQVNPSQ